jgi:hypothetical protein
MLKINLVCDKEVADKRFFSDSSFLHSIAV